MAAPSWRQRTLAAASTAGVSPAEVDYLIRGVTGFDRLQLHLATAEQFEPWHRELDALWHRRLAERVPVQYLLGWAYWRDLKLAVTPATLIPRPETELLADCGLDFCRALTDPVIADLGTGTGAVAIAVARGLPGSLVYAVDNSAAALAVARRNVESFSLQHQVSLLLGEWFTPLPHRAFDALLSNPPYIPTALIETLSPEVRLHEPFCALDGGVDGLDALRVLVEQAPTYVRPGGLWAVEVMAGQAALVENLLDESGLYRSIQRLTDFAGIERLVVANVLGQ